MFRRQAWTCLLLAALLFVSFVPGCAQGSEQAVRRILDTAVRGDTPNESVLKPLYGYVVRGYEIKNVSGDTVSATVIFESKAGTDLPKTLVFTVEDGRVTHIRD